MHSDVKSDCELFHEILKPKMLSQKLETLRNDLVTWLKKPEAIQASSRDTNSECAAQRVYSVNLNPDD